MVRRLLALLVLAVAPAIAIPTALAPAASAAPPAPVQACLNGGWQTFTEASGQPFANQGLCIAYAIHHPVSLADVASSSPFTGSIHVSDFTNGCSFIFTTFDATYPGSANVGSVTLDIAGCVPQPAGSVASFSGTDSFKTNVGTLSGSASGTITALNVGFPTFVAIEIVLGVSNGTGLFAGSTGSLVFSIPLFNSSTNPPFLGTVSA